MENFLSIYRVFFAWLMLLQLYTSGVTSGPASAAAADTSSNDEDDSEQPAVDAKSYRTYSKAAVSVYHENQLITSAFSSEIVFNDIDIVVVAFQKTFKLSLTKNRLLFSSTYIEKSVSKDGAVYHNPSKDNCYYTGLVNGHPASSAAVSLCHGLLGYFSIDKETHNIEPVEGTLRGEHRVYTQLDSEQTPFKCGHNESVAREFVDEMRLVSSLRRRKKRAAAPFSWSQDLDGQTYIVELYIVTDSTEYARYSNVVSRVFNRVKNIVNAVSLLYQSQDIYLVLVGVEIWTDNLLVTLDRSNSDRSLNIFNAYRLASINPIHRNDHAHLIVGSEFSDGVGGGAFSTAMCSYSQSSGVSLDIDGTNVANVAAILAHELGHSFGLVHDDVSKCVCDDQAGHCIMYPESTSLSPTTWSRCSMDDLKMLLNAGQDYCLHNMPEMPVDLTSCGNGLLEPGEECDCGNVPQTQCNQLCCNSTTCRLVAPATCGAGRCCNISSCQLKPMSTECRGASGSCDLAEYCSGVDATCPSDVYRQDGTQCADSTGAAAYCYTGSCKSHRYECRYWWGATISNSVDRCYSVFNRRGDKYGNCGFNAAHENFTACAPSDVACGQLHCDVDPASASSILSKSYSYYSAVEVDGFRCTVVGFNAFNVGSQRLLDQGLVPNGARCGDGKMCVSQRCVDVSTLNVPQCPNCNQHGACNSLGQCHCDPGYSPPDCSVMGLGGSNYSNPILPYINATLPPSTTAKTTTPLPELNILNSNETSTTRVASPVNPLTSVDNLPLIIAASTLGGVVVISAVVLIAIKFSKSDRSAAKSASASSQPDAGDDVIIPRPVQVVRCGPPGRQILAVDQWASGDNNAYYWAPVQHLQRPAVMTSPFYRNGMMLPGPGVPGVQGQVVAMPPVSLVRLPPQPPPAMHAIQASWPMPYAENDGRYYR